MTTRPFPLFLLVMFFSTANGEELRVSAPTNLKTPLIEISKFFEQKNPEWKVVLRFSGSSDVARQIELNAPIDVFLSDEKSMNRLQEKDLILENSRQPLLSAAVVAIAPFDFTEVEFKEPKDLIVEPIHRFAVCEESVPFGKQSQAYVKKLGLTTFPDKTMYTKDIHKAFGAVKSGEAKWTFVYEPDAIKSKRVKVLFNIPESEIPGISFAAAIPSKSVQQETAKQYLGTLNSIFARKIFENAGFTLLSSPPLLETQTKPAKKQPQTQTKPAKKTLQTQTKPQR